MAERTHYDTLGIRATASRADIRAAYRKVALRHHPDRSSDPASTPIFLAATQAYEVLNDPDRKRTYDEGLAAETRRRKEKEAEQRREEEAKRRVQSARASSSAPPRPSNVTAVTPIPTLVARLSLLFSRGMAAEAEKLADEILLRDPRQPLPYAIKGDLARSRGKMEEASRQYALAIQMDPGNLIYLRKYEETLVRVQPDGTLKGATGDDRQILSILGIVIFNLLCGFYLVLSPEKPSLQTLGPIASWTVGTLVMVFVCGIAIGALLAAGNLIDRLDAYASGQIGPTIAFGLISLISFPLAAVLYGALGLLQRGFNLSTSRLVAAIAGSMTILAIAAAIGKHGVAPLSVVLWGGNLAMLGALAGWAVADALRRS